MQNRIISLLRQGNGYKSGEDLSRQLKISRAAIWKHIDQLRKEGYDIEAVPHLGYKLVESPDKLLPAEIQFGLKTQRLGRQIIHHESISSTMEAAYEQAMDGAQEGTVIIAETQTKGKGRLGRSWSSPKGKGIYMSVILRPQLTPTDVAKLTLLTAVAVSEAILKVCDASAKIKWPNDLLVDRKKVAGILTEMNAEMDHVRFTVVGIGINVNTPLSLLPKNSTSLKQHLKQPVHRVALVQEVLRSLEQWYTTVEQNGFEGMMSRWKDLSATLGQRVRITDPSGDIEGDAIGLDEYGGLMIRNDSGVSIKRMTGDVVILS